MKERFTDWNPSEDSLVEVRRCNEIIEEYLEQGYRLTLRQLYYQFVSRDWIENSERSYKRLGNVVSKARLAGMLDWSAIEDRGRRPNIPSEWDNLSDIVEAALASYRLPRWNGQSTYAELWVEKEALAGVLEPIARRFHVPLQVNKGYSSQSAMYESAQRLLERGEGRDEICIFYLGDLDPSGEDMVRDIRERLELFTEDSLPLKVVKLALTMEQVEQFQPPPNPTKVTDSRAAGYIEQYGYECWEVDALDPRTLNSIITEAFDEVIETDKMDEILEREKEDKKALRAAVRKL